MNPHVKGVLRDLRRAFSAKPTTRCSGLLALMRRDGVRARPWLARLISREIQRNFGVYFSSQCLFGPGLRLKHPVGIVVGSGVRIGENVTLYQNVTLGGRRMGDGGGELYPQIGDGTVIFAGAVVLGDVSVGRNCTIGANAVVLQDVPDGCTAVGVPARILAFQEI